LAEQELQAHRAEEKRQHPRARVKFPARIRWRGPHGLVTEFTDTLDISRGGVLILHAHDWPAETSFWITVPYDRTPEAVQPEIPARIARIEWMPGGGKLIAFHWRVAGGEAARAEEEREASGKERRQWHRMPFALPVSVRRFGDYFPEASMTLDLSRRGARFEAVRDYKPGETIRVHIHAGEWEDGGEIPVRVVRVEPIQSSYIEPVEGQLELSFMFQWRASNQIAVVFEGAGESVS
jgi:hypothetical protein